LVPKTHVKKLGVLPNHMVPDRYDFDIFRAKYSQEVLKFVRARDELSLSECPVIGA
jgi:hypothetical protein